jgi:hypothetical protein
LETASRVQQGLIHHLDFLLLCHQDIGECEGPHCEALRLQELDCLDDRLKSIDNLLFIAVRVLCDEVVLQRSHVVFVIDTEVDLRGMIQDALHSVDFEEEGMTKINPSLHSLLCF